MSVENSGDRRFSQVPAVSLSEATPPSTFDSFNTANDAAFSFNQNPFSMANTLQDRLNNDPDKMEGTSPFPIDAEMEEDMTLDRQMMQDEDFDIDLEIGDMTDGKYDDGDIDLDIDVEIEGHNLSAMENDMQMGSPFPEEQHDVVLDDAAEAQEEDIELGDRGTMPQSPADMGNYNIHSEPSIETNEALTAHENQLEPQITPLENLSSLSEQTTQEIHNDSTDHTSQLVNQISDSRQATDVQNTSTSQAQEPLPPSPQSETQVYTPPKLVLDEHTSQLNTNQAIDELSVPPLPSNADARETEASTIPTIEVVPNEVRISQADTLALDNTPQVPQHEWSETTSATIANESERDENDDYQASPRPESRPQDSQRGSGHVPQDSISTINSPIGSPQAQDLETDRDAQNPLNDAQSVADESETRLHPVVVAYKGMEYSLFKMDQKEGTPNTQYPETFFFDDISCVIQPFGEIVRDIRQILGFDITPNDELLIKFESLGLIFEEHNNALNSFSLASIIDLHVYSLTMGGQDVELPLLFQLDTRLGYVSQLEMIKNHLNSGGNLETLPKARVYPVSGQMAETVQKTSEDQEIVSVDVDQSDSKETVNIEGQLDPTSEGVSDHDPAGDKGDNHEDELLELEDHEKYDTFDLPGPGLAEENEQSRSEDEEEEEEPLLQSDLPASNIDIQEKSDKVRDQDDESASSINIAINQEVQTSTGNDNSTRQTAGEFDETAETDKQFDDLQSHDYSEQPQAVQQEELGSILDEDHTFTQQSGKQVPSLRVIDDEATPQANTETRTDSPAGSYAESELNLKTTLNIPAFEEPDLSDTNSAYNGLYEDEQHEDKTYNTDDDFENDPDIGHDPNNQLEHDVYDNKEEADATYHQDGVEAVEVPQEDDSRTLQQLHGDNFSHTITDTDNSDHGDDLSNDNQDNLEYDFGQAEHFDDDDAYGSSAEFAIFPQAYEDVTGNGEGDELYQEHDDYEPVSALSANTSAISGEKRARDEDDDDDIISMTEADSSGLGPKRRRAS